MENREFVWQDRDIRFDDPPHNLECRKGEILIDSINSVEDTKGNNGERGSLIVTNLRLIWASHKNPKVNLSIGFNSVMVISIKKAKSKLSGNTQALYVMAKYQSRYEFIFTSLVKSSPRLFTTVQAVLAAYESSKAYRDLKLRASIIKDGELLMLPNERLMNRIAGVWNLSSEQGVLGTFYITNVRLVWFANLAPNFNVSVPYIQIQDVRVRESRFGKALVVEVWQRSGGYVLGFRIDRQETLTTVFKEVKAMAMAAAESPMFGVEVEHDTARIADLKGKAKIIPISASITEDVEIVNADADEAVAAAYYATEDGADGGADDGGMGAGASGGAGGGQVQLQLDRGLGLAVEPPPKGVSIESLWRLT